MMPRRHVEYELHDKHHSENEMASAVADVDALVGRQYKEGFVTEIDSDTLPPGLDEGVIKAISARKNEPAFMLEWRLEAFRRWQSMVEPAWAHVRLRQPPTTATNRGVSSVPSS